MKRLPLLLSLTLVGTLLSATPAAASHWPQRPQSGEIRMTIHTHSNDDPDWPGLLFPTERLPFDFAPGEYFSYSSRTCSGGAPFNDLGLDFVPDYPGVDDESAHTAPVRHRVEGTVIAGGSTRGVIQGQITTVLCVPGPDGMTESAHAIVSDFWVRYVRVSDNALLVSGAFRISPTESTGTFRDMRGGGRMEGRFTCLAHQRDPSQPSCAQRGHYTDFVGHRGDPTLGPGEILPGLVGRYYDPTVTTGASSG